MRFAPFLLAAPLLVGCVNTDTAVFVEATITDPVLTIGAGSVLVTSMSGSFKLQLHLGARASGPSQVYLKEAKLQDATGTTTLLNLTVKEAVFPVVVEPDTTVPVALTFADDSISSDIKDALCDPKGVVLAAKIDDSLQDAATDATSILVNATGCN